MVFPKIPWRFHRNPSFYLPLLEAQSSMLEDGKGTIPKALHRLLPPGKDITGRMGGVGGGIPSGELTKSYWKWWFIVDFPIKNGDFPWQNVSSPEGMLFWNRRYQNMAIVAPGEKTYLFGKKMTNLRNFDVAVEERTVLAVKAIFNCPNRLRIWDSSAGEHMSRKRLLRCFVCCSKFFFDY